MQEIHPNSSIALEDRIDRGLISTTAPLLSLPMRALLCLALQALTALLVTALGSSIGAWRASAELWPLFGTVANLLTIRILMGMVRREGITVRQLWARDVAGERRGTDREEDDSRGGDLSIAITATLVGVIFVVVVHFGLSALLFDSAARPFEYLQIQGPAPLRWGMGLLYAVTGAFAVYPLFMGFAVPRLAAISGVAGAAYFLGALWIGAHHITLPFIAEWQYLVWRLFLFLPLSIFLFATVVRRPGTLRYLMVAFVFIHVVLLVLIETMGQAALPNS